MTQQTNSKRSIPKEEITLRLSVSAIIKGMQLVESGRFDTFDQVFDDFKIYVSLEQCEPDFLERGLNIFAFQETSAFQFFQYRI